MNNKINVTPNVISFKSILGNGKYYSVPPFQRDYSWDESNWEELWNDIWNIYQSQDEHYMGDILLKKENSENFEIIDGQQRITTISLLIYAISKVFKDKGSDELSVRAKQEFLQKRQIGGISFEPKLTLNNTNKSFYSILIDQSDPQRPSVNEPKSNKLIYLAFDYFYKKINNLFNDKSIKELDEFLSIFTRDLIFIEIIVTSDENAFLVFENVNARGKNLTPTDLIKNYILSFGSDKTTLEYWNKISEILDKDLLSFIKHYLNTKYTDNFTEKEIFKVFRNKFSTPDSVKQFLNDSYKYANFYVALSDPTSSFWVQNYTNSWQEITKNIAELRIFSTRTVQYKSLLLGVFIGLNDKLDTIVDLISTLIFRYNTIASKNPNDLTPIFNKLAHKIAKKELQDLTEIKKELQKIYISDEEFGSIFVENNFDYARPANKKLIEYILFQIESKINNKQTLELKDPLATLEHILPQNDSNIANKELYKYINNIANFTLLSASDNRKAENLEFSKKLQIYKESSYTMTKELFNRYSDWEVSEIKHRQQYLLKFAKIIWKIDF